MGGPSTHEVIVTDLAALGEKPVIASTRISVQPVLEKLGDGWTVEDTLDDYPHLTPQQVVAALAYAAEAALLLHDEHIRDKNGRRASLRLSGMEGTLQPDYITRQIMAMTARSQEPSRL